MNLTFFNHQKDPCGTRYVADWEQLLATLRKPREHKHKNTIPQFSAAIFEGDHRGKRACIEVSMLVLDFDNSGELITSQSDACAILRYEELRHVVYDTWSSTEKQPRFRVIVPLKTPIPGEAWQRWVDVAIPILGMSELTDSIDMKATRDRARAWYLPCNGAACQAYSGEPALIQVPPKPKKKPAPVLHVVPSSGYLHAVIDGEIRRVSEASEGDRNETLNRSAFALGQFLGQGLDRIEAFGLLLIAATACGLPDDHTTHATIDSGLDGGSREPRGVPEPKHAAPIPISRPRETAPSCKSMPSKPHEVMDRFVQIAGLDSVYDREQKVFFRLAEFDSMVRGNVWEPHPDKPDRTRPWKFLDDGKRDLIYKNDIGFWPGKTIEPPKINLFTGFDIAQHKRVSEPEETKCVKKIRHLLKSMCDDDESERFILTWLAWPFQNLGNRLRSALVVRGPQGVGKSLFFGYIMLKLYGRWGQPIGQPQLDSAFNDWISRKLYAVAEEVNTHANVRVSANRLKGLITAEEVLINQKFMSERVEENHCNLVFVSNERMPTWLDRDDRRHFVLDIPASAKQTPEFYADLVREFDKQPHAWYQFLRYEWPCTKDFSTRAVPMTAGKQALLDQCESAPDQFIKEWLGGDLSNSDMAMLDTKMPTLELIYRVFTSWAEASGRPAPSKRTFACSLVDNKFTKGRFKSRGDTRDIRYWRRPSIEESGGNE